MDFSFEDWIQELGLSENGLKCIVKAELTDLKALVLVDIRDLDEIKLSLGDRGKIKYGIETLKADHAELFRSKNPPKNDDGVKVQVKAEPSVIEQSIDQKYSVEEVTALLENQRLSFQNVSGRLESAALRGPDRGSTPPPYIGQATTKSLGRDGELSRRAQDYAGPLVSDLLAIGDSAADSKARGEKPYLPINFVSYLRGQHPDEESIIQTANGTDLILRDNVRKPVPEKLTTGQYIEASHRIFRLLAPTLTGSEFDAYIEYMSEIGILLQIFTIGSVFLLDHLHRQDVHLKGRRWDNINHTLQIAILKKKDDPTNFVSNQKNAKKSGGSMGSARPTASGNSSFSNSGGSDVPCWHYNQQNKVCRFTPCRFPHICSIENCKGNHPAFRHVYANQSSGPPQSNSESNFRPQSQTQVQRA
jgi:hypothetical protein